MSITKALVFDKVTINGVDFTPHLSESAEVTIEAIEQVVDNGQTLPSAWQVNFSVDVLDTAADGDSNVYTVSNVDPIKTWIKFEGVPGAATLNITDVIISVTPNFEGERTAYTFTGSKIVTDIATTVLST